MTLVSCNLFGFGYPWLNTFSDRAPEVWGASATVAQELKTICMNGKDWEDHMLAAVGMSTAWRARGMMPQFYVEMDGKYLSSPLDCFFLCLLVCFANYVGLFIVCRSREDPSF